MSLPLTPSKRPLDSSPSESNGKGKSQKSTVVYPQLPALKISPGSVVFRVLCPVSKSGSVIGKGGSIVSQIRQETGAKIRVEEALPGDDERVIVIVGPEKEVEEGNEESKEDEDKDVAEEGDDDTKEEDDSVEEEENDESNEDKESAPVEDLQTEKATSVVQKALLLIFERMVEGEPENDEGDEENKKSLFVLRLLVLSTQVGCLLGKGGSVIKQMAAETGAQIRILPRDKLPVCATAVDELVQLTGGVDKVRKALQSVSKQLLENPPRDHTFPASKPTGPSSTPFGPPVPKPDVHPPQNQNFSAQGAPYATVPHDRGDYQLTGPPPMHKYRENVFPNRMKPFQEVTFRLLCYNEKVGGVIGKGGTIVKALQHDTGCEIKIMESLPGSEDRLITISGPAHPDDRLSAAQDAVLRVQNRIYRATPDISEKNLIARIIVPSNQIGCILGKGGAVIAEMRKFTGAHIRIVPRDKISLCAADNEEVVQISGEFESVQEALLQITTRLQQHHFRDTFPSINHPSHPSFPEQVAPFPSFNGRREHSPPGMYSNLGPFNKFDAGGMLPHGRFLPHDDRSSFAHNIHRPGIPLHGSGRIPPSAPWEHQGIPNSGGPRGMPDYAGGPPQRRMPGFVGGSQAPIITSTTVEVSVPRSVVPSIYGEDGSSLKKIRQISGAKITITEPRPGATDTAIIIHGTPEQTHAAQSLLQAFVMSGATSP